MDAKRIGSTIAALRKKSGMTQLELAQKLDVSDKAVSKWENGQGFPDITAFPRLAALFGVTIDYLMLGEKKGITIAGNILVDIVKNIDIYPKLGMLGTVSDISPAVGGCAPNTAINLAKIDRSVPISVLGRVGTDENGRYVMSQLQKNGINVDGIVYSPHTETGFCDVMSIPSGERTFFHKAGTNAEFCPDDVDIPSLDCDILHIGYILLMKQFDTEDPEYGTVMARFLAAVQKAGIRTSIDVVSDSVVDYGKMITPSLRYCNYAIMNEIEGCGVSGLDPRRPDGSIDEDNIRRTMEMMLELGVRDRVILHSKEAGFMLTADGVFRSAPAVDIDPAKIAGKVGAGDAFCAGSLYGLYTGISDDRLLDFASAAAVCNLTAPDSISGMQPAAVIRSIVEAGRYIG